MQINREYEQEIDLKDLIFHILYHWRGCIVAALIGAVLLGGFRYVKNLRQISAQQAAPAVTAAESAEEEDTDYMLENYQQTAASYSRILEGYNQYRQNSILMQVDPNQKWVATATYCVKIKPDALEALPQLLSYDPADDVVIAYTEKVRENLNSEELKKVFGTADTRYIGEIVETVPAYTVARGGRRISGNVGSAEWQSNTFTIRVTGLDANMAEAGLRCFEDCVQAFFQGDGQKIASHDLIRVSHYVAAEADPDLEIRQVEISKNFDAYKSALANAEKAGTEQATASGPIRATASVKKFAAVGFLLGGFLAVCAYLAQYVLGGRLHDAGELSEAYSLPVYGAFTRSRARRPGKGIDKLLEKMEFGRSRADSATVSSGICALIREKHAGKKVLLTGTVSEQELLPLAELLKKQLGGAAEIETQANFVRNEDAVQAGGAADAVILVEKKEASRTREIERMAEILQISQAKVAGCIIL